MTQEPLPLTHEKPLPLPRVKPILQATSQAPRPILHIPSDTEYKQTAMETIQETLHSQVVLPPMGPSMLSTATTTGQAVDSEDVVSSQPSTGNQTPEHLRDDVVLGPDNVPDYEKVLNWAEFLVGLRTERVLKMDQVNQLIHLWDHLSEYDQKRTIFPKRYTDKPAAGKFASRGRHVAPGVESITKVLLGPNRGPAQSTDCNRYQEATVKLLLKLFPGDQKREGRVCTRWRLVLDAYHHIRSLIIDPQLAMQMTEI